MVSHRSHVWVLEGPLHRLTRYELDGRLEQEYRDLNQPSAMFPDGAGVVVIDAGGTQLSRFALDGRLMWRIPRFQGLNIVLPHEQAPNRYVTPHLSFQFHYFALRKMHFLLRARAVAVFPGGFGTFDEFFELLTLIQTGKMKPIPILLFGRDFWTRVVNFEALCEEGTISPPDLELFRWCETADEAWGHIAAFYELGR